MKRLLQCARRQLARCLTEHADVPVALSAYEEDRLPKTAQIVRMNRNGGPEGVIDVVEQRAPSGFTQVTDLISRDDLEATLKDYAVAAGFSREQVNR